MQLKLEVENIKCGGCARSIEKALRADSRVTAVTVDASAGTVLVQASGDVRPEALATLARLGYPQKGSVEGLRCAAALARSFVSCAVGRMSDG
jgi:copper chaperone